MYNYIGIHFKDSISLLPNKKALVDVEMREGQTVESTLI